MDLKASLLKDTTHVVIQFKKLNAVGQRVVELVHKYWLVYRKNRNKWYCKYPPKNDYNMVEKWVKIGKLPQPKWNEWEILILKKASKGIFFTIV